MTKRRESTWKLLQPLGINAHPKLPDLGDLAFARDKRQTEDRTLALLTCVAASFGFPRVKAQAWLAKEGLGHALESEEVRFLLSVDDARVRSLQVQVQGLWALAWALGQHAQPLAFKALPTNAVHQFPALKAGHPTEPWRAKGKLLDRARLLDERDVLYCLHWALVESRRTGSVINSELTEEAVAQRRRAMEWLFTATPWYSIQLDT